MDIFLDKEQWAQHGSLRLGWLDLACSGRSLTLGDCVSVLLPTGAMRVSLDASSSGHRYRGMVGSTGASVLPPCLRLDVEEVAPGPMLVLTLATDFMGERLGRDLRVRGAPSTSDPYLYRLGRMLRSAFRIGRLPPPLMLDGIARELRDHIVAHYATARRRQTVRPLSEDRLERARGFMASNFGDNSLSVRRVAESVGLSPFHFTRLFTAAIGQAPHSYITQLRMAEAKRLLGSTCLPIAEIAQRTGYATHAHFTGMFGRHVGMTPAAYRTHVRAERARARAQPFGT